VSIVTCDPWFVENLACPADHAALQLEGQTLVCGRGHRYPVVDGVPVMLTASFTATMDGVEQSLRRAQGDPGDARAPELYLESLGISEEEKAGVVELARRGGGVDPVVAYLVAATNGLMYRHLIGALDRYPVPEITLPAGNGRLLLDVGCSWGRWSLAAHTKGYTVVGIDPSLGAVMAARRVARQLGIPNRYIVGDARALPFRPGLFDVAYSYSVVQHLSRPDAALAVGEMARVLKAGGLVRVQMPTRYGLRCLYHQARRRFREAVGFEVRYWSTAELSRLFTSAIGQTRFEVDGFFGIGLQASDEALMTPRLRTALHASETLKKISRVLPALSRVADSVFVVAVKARA
jgi:SAM-dependent methyltransferase/uncharacterized protein YbaR (Trm112 family)